MILPLVSVIIPTHNRVGYLYSCLKSVLNQNYKNIELIVVDDGSIDDTQKMVRKIKTERLRYFKQKNKGVSAARNLGIRKAQGKYITFCDDDDLYLQGKIKIQVNFLEKHRDIAMCFTNGWFVYTNPKKVRLFKSKLEQNTLEHLLLNNNQILTPTVMIRKNALKTIGEFNTKYRVCEDYDMWLRIARKYKFDYIDIPTVKIIRHSGNLTNNEKELFRLSVKIKISNLKKSKTLISSKSIKKFNWMLEYQLGKYYFFEHRLINSRKHLLKAFLIDPLSPKSVVFLIYTVLGENIFDRTLIPTYEILKKRRYDKTWETISD